MRFVLPMMFVAVFGLLAQAEDRHPAKSWDRQGPLGETPKRTTDAFPLSDQENKGGWVNFAPMTGMPDDKDLPSTFSIEYVRAWKRK